jgi:hypothetical protein
LVATDEEATGTARVIRIGLQLRTRFERVLDVIDSDLLRRRLTLCVL